MLNPFTVAAIRCSQNYGEALRTHDNIDLILKDSLIGFAAGFAECQSKNLIYSASKTSDEEEEDLTRIMAATAIGSSVGAAVECAKCFFTDAEGDSLQCMRRKGVEGAVGVSCAVVAEAVVTAFGVENVGGVVGGMICRGLMSKMMGEESSGGNQYVMTRR
eukprot:TRINITY_DN10079_c0_g1_i2.p3 TRINITY_DN10079_c0_g1~~TRINITY_DN10079_c0_g1_i2.p3  ORF type:complete len:161 (-),score=41.03 TRINITY_DN10079_c0_g1_i2:1242-1724(-)